MNFVLLGHQRSGTNFFLDLLTHNKSIDAVNEPFSMHLDFFRENEDIWTSDDYNSEYLHLQLRDKPITRSYLQELANWLNSDSEKVLGFKETSLIEKYGWLKRCLHIEKTLILIRDPRAIYNSVIKRGLQNSFWNYRGRILNYYDSSNIDIDSDLDVVCNLIKFRVNRLIAIHDNKDTDTFLIKLEDVLLDSDRTMTQTMEYLNLDYEDAQKQFLFESQSETRNSTFSNFRKKEDVLYDWKHTISNRNRKQIEKIFEDILFRFEYI